MEDTFKNFLFEGLDFEFMTDRYRSGGKFSSAIETLYLPRERSRHDPIILQAHYSFPVIRPGCLFSQLFKLILLFDR
jgi:hypothetical protein